MAKRFVLARVISAFDPNEGAVVNRHAVQLHPDVAYEGNEIPTDDTGTPTVPWILVLVGSQNIAALSADPDIRVMPDISLDARLIMLEPAALTAMQSALTEAGFAITIRPTVDSMREIMDAAGKRANAAFNVDAFDIDAS